MIDDYMTIPMNHAHCNRHSGAHPIYFKYMCLQAASFWNHNNRADLIILLASSNFLHSGSVLQQINTSLF
ncbi:uncharacterized protein OCT59_001714 [Rhizophagus irregularis]|uniref:uncharacterized protein n=1 Tax=Rhizophagus irregularis TaxID=588596 RepID=UPI00331DDC64|nr:hypothetical protein OCT59_001714 [Rhizophagus irregularis]